MTHRHSVFHIHWLVATCALTIAAAILLAACNRPDTASSQDAASVALPAHPVSVFALDVGNAVGEEQSVKPMTIFAPTDKLIASIRMRGVAAKADLSAKLIYQDGQVYGEQAQTIHPTGPVTTNFTFPRETAWPRGRYFVEVTLNGKRAVQQPIEVGDVPGSKRTSK